MQQQTLLVGRTSNNAHYDLWTSHTEFDRETKQLIPLGVFNNNSPLALVEENSSLFVDVADKTCNCYKGHPIYLENMEKHPDICIVKIAYASVHMAMLTDRGTVYSLGYNEDGQVTPEKTPNVHLPVLMRYLVERGLEVADIDAYGWTTYYVTTTGRIFMSGRNAWMFMTEITGNNQEPLRYVGCNQSACFVEEVRTGKVLMTRSDSEDDTVEVLLQYITGVDPRDDRIKMCMGSEATVFALFKSGRLYKVQNEKFEEVDFFRTNRILIRDMVCTWYQSVFLTTDGRAYRMKKDGDDIYTLKTIPNYCPDIQLVKGSNAMLFVNMGQQTIYSIPKDRVKTKDLARSTGISKEGLDFVGVYTGFYGVVLLYNRGGKSRRKMEFQKSVHLKSSRNILTDIDVKTV